MIDPGEYLNPLKKIIIDSGKAILSVYHNLSPQDIKEKADKSPLTLADQMANEIICTGLKEIAPEIPIISEENAAIPFAQRRHYDYCWMVDPLDGTKEFINRNGEFTVNIALIKNSKPILGIVYIPINEVLYFASEQKGAFCQENDSIVPIRSNSFQMSDRCLRVVSSRSHMNDATKSYLENLKSPEIIAKGSSLKFLIIASGEADLYPRLGPTMEWDTAAAHCILEEAGGSILSFESGDALKYNKESLLNPNFIASGIRIPTHVR